MGWVEGGEGRGHGYVGGGGGGGSSIGTASMIN